MAPGAMAIHLIKLMNLLALACSDAGLGSVNDAIVSVEPTDAIVCVDPNVIKGWTKRSWKNGD